MSARLRATLEARTYPVLAVVEVHDGDTYRLLLDVGFEQASWPWLRLRGASCPELSDTNGLAAKNAAEELLRDGVAAVTTYKRPGYSDMEKSFARYLADVHLGNGRQLADVLIEANLAVRKAQVH